MRNGSPQARFWQGSEIGAFCFTSTEQCVQIFIQGHEWSMVLANGSLTQKGRTPPAEAAILALCIGKELQHIFLLRIIMLVLEGILKIHLVPCFPTQTILRRGGRSKFSTMDQLKLYRCNIYLLNSSINSGNLFKLFLIRFFYHWNKTLIHIKDILFKDEFYRF